MIMMMMMVMIHGFYGISMVLGSFSRCPARRLTVIPGAVHVAIATCTVFRAITTKYIHQWFGFDVVKKS